MLHLQQLHAREQQQQVLSPLHLAAAAYACAAAPRGFLKTVDVLQRLSLAARRQLNAFSVPEMSQLFGSLTKAGVDCRILLPRCAVLTRRAAAAPDWLQQQQVTGSCGVFAAVVPAAAAVSVNAASSRAASVAVAGWHKP